MVWDAIVDKVHDGDTVNLDIDIKKAVRGVDKTLGFHVYIANRRLRFHNATRLYGINAPELTTDAGKAARAALQRQLPVGTAVQVTTWLAQNDKYGRLLGRICLPTKYVNQWMVTNGHASVYYGTGPKQLF
jgi:endonuclease YncB( thermonuclease family)